MTATAASCPAPLNRLTSHTERRREPSVDQIKQAAAARVATREAAAQASQPIVLDIEIVLTDHPAEHAPVCRVCLVSFDVVDRHWLFVKRCDCCGSDRVEQLVRRIVRGTSGSATRAIKALERGPAERDRELSMGDIQAAALARLRKSDPALAAKLATSAK